MMTEPVRKLYRESKTNKDFIGEMKAADNTFKRGRWYMDDMEKIMCASIYMGWLVAKGLYNEDKYY